MTYKTSAIGPCDFSIKLYQFYAIKVVKDTQLTIVVCNL